MYINNSTYMKYLHIKYNIYTYKSNIIFSIYNRIL
jgi:hypothetical protein